MEFSTDASSAMLPVAAEWRSGYQDYLQSFPSDQVFIIVFENVLCSAGGWSLIVEAERLLSDLEIVERTHSIASESSLYIESTPDAISTDKFGLVEFASNRERCRAAAEYGPYKNNLVTTDGFATAMMVFVRPDSDAVASTQIIKAALADLVQSSEAIGGRIIVTGEPVMSAAVSVAVEKDSALLAALFCSMLLLIYLLTRSARLVFLTMAMNLFVLLGAVGSIGWIGITLTPATTLALFLLLPLSSAFCIHAYAYELRTAGQRGKSSIAGFGFAAISTALGFAATGATEAGDVRNLALMGVIGIVFAIVGIALFVRPLIGKVESSSLVKRMIYPVRVLGRPNYSLAFLVIALLMVGFGLPQVRVNYEPTDYLPTSNVARADFETVGKYFGKMTVPAVFELDDIYDPAGWREIEELIQKLKSDHQFETVWFFDYLSEFAKAFEHSPSNRAFPETEEALYQYLQFIDAEDLSLLVNPESNRLLVLFQIPYEGSRNYNKFESQVRGYVELTERVSVEFPGRVSAFFGVGHRIGFDTLVGLAISMVVVFLVLWLMLRSLPLAIGAVCCNFLPVLIGLSTLGLLGIDIDMGSSIVAAIAFGIVLDDSAHLMFRVRELVRSGYDPFTAVTQGVSDLFIPILMSTIVIVCGFSFLWLAELQTFNDFAVVMVTTLIAALVADVLLLPYVIRKLTPDPLRT